MLHQEVHSLLEDRVEVAWLVRALDDNQGGHGKARVSQVRREILAFDGYHGGRPCPPIQELNAIPADTDDDALDRRVSQLVPTSLVELLKRRGSPPRVRLVGGTMLLGLYGPPELGVVQKLVDGICRTKDPDPAPV